LFAGLQIKNGRYFPDSVVIAGLDGVVRANATFTPVTPPPVDCLGTRLPPAAYVAAGKVFFADGVGAIRSLSPDGQVQEITTFATSRQQMLSYAVSPDGTTLLATVLTVPPRTSAGILCIRSARHYTSDFNVFSAHAGTTPQLLYQQRVPEGATHSACYLQLVGWDQIGPYGIYPACVGPGGGPVHYPGPVVRVSPETGRVNTPIIDPRLCRVEDIVLTGDFVCDPVTPSTECCGTGDISVRRSDGHETWHFAAKPNGQYYYDFLSPDERHVLSKGWGAEVLGRDATDIKLNSTGFFDGWLDSSTVIGSFNGGNLAYVSLTAPTKMINLGFAGAFVGTLST
jgi:hypothetical protein